MDVAMLAFLTLPAGRRRPIVPPGGAVSRSLTTAREVVGEQLRTPGQLLFGTRTVDRRTGARVELWRTIVLAAAGMAGGELTRRLVVKPTPERDRDREAFFTDMQEIMRRYPQASPERDVARQELLARNPPMVIGSGTSLLRVAAPSLLVGVFSKRLRRRLAPTVEVLARRD